jgi:hypothetical protein
MCQGQFVWHDQVTTKFVQLHAVTPDGSVSMRARRLSRLAGLVLALAALAIPARAASGGGFTTMDYDWGAPSATVVVDTAPGSGAGSTLVP